MNYNMRDDVYGERKYLLNFISNPLWNGVDIGCGGRKFCKSAIGLDTARNTVTDFSQPNITEAEWVGSGESLPFKDNVLDYISSCHTLEHMGSWQNALQEWYRCLKAHGILALVVPNPEGRHLHGHGIPKEIVIQFLIDELCMMIIQHRDFSDYSYGIIVQKGDN